MTKLSMRKISVLGLVLMGASAVTAAIIPSKAKSDAPRVNNGVLQASSVGSLIQSCVPHATLQQCTATVGAQFTATTVGAGVTSADFPTLTATPTSGNVGLNTSAGA